jgi:3-oxoacyl-[acyl-carrier protein] reductase
MRLAGRVALVTGGSRGIGAAVCRAYGREGARVVVNYQRAAEQAYQVVSDIQAAGGEAIAVQADVAQAADVIRMVATAREQFGPIDILVANAAVYPRAPWDQLDEAQWDRVMAVNLKGAMLCAQQVCPDMRARGYGKIITVSSVTAELGWGPYLHYVTTKAGLIGFTRSLAREVGKAGIRVNCIMPGAIQTEQELADFPDQAALATFLAERQCLPQRGVPEDMVGAFLFLASAESDFITGQLLNVDGGWVHY